MLNRNVRQARTRLLLYLLVVCKGHRVAPAGLAILAVAAGLSIAPTTVTLPQVRTTIPVFTTTTLLAGAVAALLALSTLTEPAASVARTSPRGWARLRATRALLATAAAAAALTAARPVAAGFTLVVVLALIGEGMLLASRVGTKLAWILPTSHLAAAATFGTSRTGETAPWAWIIEPHASTGALLTSLLLYSIGLTFWMHSPDHDITDPDQ
ncbi:hypothetical protein [Actinopolymorpha alba]|uniref:hypothetical protein n=1 Tax=Actinopolymorpha alba TaxID=533267 RepID=UPI0003696590|nr:hypothetical protein [Actinopolymorpha alba]